MFDVRELTIHHNCKEWGDESEVLYNLKDIAKIAEFERDFAGYMYIDIAYNAPRNQLFLDAVEEEVRKTEDKIPVIVTFAGETYISSFLHDIIDSLYIPGVLSRGGNVHSYWTKEKNIGITHSSVGEVHINDIAEVRWGIVPSTNK